MKVAIYIKETLIERGIEHIIRERYPHATVEFSPDLHRLSSPKNTDPEIIILDPSLLDPPVRISLEKIYTLHPDSKLVAVCCENPDESLVPYFDGIIHLNASEKEILSVLDRIFDSFARQPAGSGSTDLISEREKDVLRGVALGLTNKEISESLHISCHTVITHRKNISAKIGIKTIAGLAVYAVLNGIIAPDELDSQ